MGTQRDFTFVHAFAKYAHEIATTTAMLRLFSEQMERDQADPNLIAYVAETDRRLTDFLGQAIGGEVEANTLIEAKAGDYRAWAMAQLEAIDEIDPVAEAERILKEGT